MTTPGAPTYQLVRAGRVAEAPALDADQRRVVEHRGGPLLVLAGPGTGKTTTLVEAIVDRVERGGVAPENILALTFSRKAAEQLRDRVTARLGCTMATSLASTFHSFAYGLVRRYAPPELYTGPLRLLSAPEQDVVLRELLTTHPESVSWPGHLQRALATRGFAREVNAVLSRAREKGLEPADLEALGREHGLPEFEAAGLFLEQYLENLDHHGATDYADLIRRATIEAADHRPELRAQYTHVFVDEYQDTDPGQVALLRQLSGDGGNLVVVGDPHQSIYGFRGAEVRGILDFPTEFPDREGNPATVVALGTTRRFGPRLLTASQRVAARLPLPGTIPSEAKQAFTSPRSEPAAEAGPGRVEVRTHDTDRAEVEHIADLLRRAHLEHDVPWSEMAVLVRSGRTTIPPLRRALGAAGVPVEVATDEVPLVRDPAVLPLLDALSAVVNLDNHDPDHVDYLHAHRAESLLTGPLGGLDAGDVRRLARLLRTREKERAHAEGVPALASRDLLRLALVDPHFLDELPGPEAERTRELTALLHGARAELDEGASAEEVLWRIWSSTGWPERLRRGIHAGGGTARRAHRDLDSVCALFDVVARAEEQRLHLGVPDLLATLHAQQIPADTLAERGGRGAAVRLLTAHRSKGLEWRLVVVAHVQQELWPDLRRRATLLQADRIGAGPDGGELVPPVTPRELLLEERRLFYVACTRARERLVVTAVASPDPDGEQPSRFLAELVSTSSTTGRAPIEHVVGRPPRPLSMAGLVSELRRTAADSECSPALREAAARRLARLAPEVPAADPATWWGTRAATRSERAVRDPDQPVPISASALESMLACPMQAFLQREAGGVSRSHQSANLGELVHALAQRVASGEVEAGPDDVDVLMRHIDQVWERLEFRTPWSRRREHERIRVALGRFLRWHHANPRELLGVEQAFRAVVTLDDGERVQLAGYADRLEVDADGRVVVVDLKTARRAPTGPQVKGNVQLGLYQYAVDAGGVEPPDDAPVRTGGAELVQLGLEDDATEAKVQEQPAHDDDDPDRLALREHLATTASLLRTEIFPAVSGQWCRDCEFVSLCPVKGAGSVIDS